MYICALAALAALAVAISGVGEACKCRGGGEFWWVGGWGGDEDESHFGALEEGHWRVSI